MDEVEQREGFIVGIRSGNPGVAGWVILMGVSHRRRDGEKEQRL